MGILRLSLNSFKKNFKKTAGYIISMIISFAFIFTVCAIGISEGVQGENSGGTVIQWISTVLLIASVILIYYANREFLINKREEMMVQAMSGISPGKIALFTIIQNLIISIISVIFGIGLALLILLIIANVINLDGGLMALVGKEVFTFSLFILFVEFAYVIILDWAYISMIDMKDMIMQNKELVMFRRRKLKGAGIVYLIMFFLPLIIALTPISKNSANTSLVFFIYTFTIIGTIGVYKNYFVKVLTGLMPKKNEAEVTLLKNILNYSLSDGYHLYVGATVMICIFSIMFMLAGNELLYAFSYFGLIIFFAIAMVYKFIVESYNFKQSYKELHILGVNRKSIGKLINKVVALSLAGFVGVNILNMTMYYIALYRMDQININIYLITVGFMIITFLVVYFLVSYIYRKVVNGFIGGC